MLLDGLLFAAVVYHSEVNNIHNYLPCHAVCERCDEILDDDDGYSAYIMNRNVYHAIVNYNIQRLIRLRSLPVLFEKIL